MKNITRLIISAALLLPPAVKAQQSTEPQPQTTGEQGQPARVEDDPAFKLLSPEAQAWARNLRAIIERVIKDKEREQQHLPIPTGDPDIFDFRAVVQPRTVIGNHTFTSHTIIDRAVLSDNGEMAFVARWTDFSGNERAAVFSSQRIVVSVGDVIDGKYIAAIAKDAIVAINSIGQVAYEASYANDKDEALAGYTQTGIFIDHHLALIPNVNAKHTDFILTNDGWIARRPKPRFVFGDFSQFPTNASGQVLIPVNLSPSGFLLLLGTPITH